MKRVAANNQQRESDRQQELRALDAWIAEHVMGWKLWNAYPDTRETGDSNNPTYQGFHPTTDPAAAMEVLRKCIDHVGAISEIRIYQREDDFYGLTVEHYGRVINHSACTLTKAICNFAAALFSKEAKP